MSLKNVCSIPLHWTLEDYRQHTCSDGSHSHLTRSELHKKEEKNLVVLLLEGKNRKEKTVAYVLPEATPSKSFRLTESINKGLSYRVGETLATAVYRKELWAETMLASINPSRLTPPADQTFDVEATG